MVAVMFSSVPQAAEKLRHLLWPRTKFVLLVVQSAPVIIFLANLWLLFYSGYVGSFFKQNDVQTRQLALFIVEVCH